MPTSASNIKQQQDNHMTTLLLANNLLSSLTALTTVTILLNLFIEILVSIWSLLIRNY